MTRRVEITITVNGRFCRWTRATMTEAEQREWIDKYATTAGAVIEVRHVG